MKTISIPIFVGLLFLFPACKQPVCPEVKSTPDGARLYDLIANSSAGYDSAFAKSLGADAYGMRKYVLAFLKKGPKRDQDSTTVAQLQKAHLENIIRMAENGKLVLAGPFLDDGEVRGIYILLTIRILYSKPVLALTTFCTRLLYSN